MYTKKFEHLMQMLQVSRQSGLLIVESAEPGESGWQGRIRLVDGNATACQIYQQSSEQVILSGNDAIRWLIAQTKLNWNLREETQSPSILSLPPPSQQRSTTRPGRGDTGPQRPTHPEPMVPSSWIPRRTKKGTMISVQSLGSFELLQVFTLVNERNTLEGIARLLRKPPQDTFQKLNMLREAGLIE